MTIARVATGLVLAILLASAPAWAQGCGEEHASWPHGQTWTVTGSGEYAVFNSGAALLVADASDPLEPEVVAELAMPERVHEVAASGELVFVSASDGVRVFDVSTAGQPVQVGHYEMSDRPQTMTASGAHLHLIDIESKLRIIDLSNPAEPVEIGVLGSLGSGRDLAVADGRAYVADLGGFLRIVDVSNPNAPFAIGSFAPPPPYGEYVTAVAVAGDRAYVAAADSGFISGAMHVVDVSDPQYAFLLGSYELIDAATDVAVWQDLAFVAEPYYGGVHVVDVADPTQPEFLRSVGGSGDVSQMVARGGLLLIAEPRSGIWFVHVSGSVDQWNEVVLHNPGEIQRAAVGGGLYFAAGHGVRVLDMDGPGVPAVVAEWERNSNWPESGTTFALALSSRFAYLSWYSDSWTKLQVLNIEDPSDIRLVNELQLGYIRELELDGDSLYAADRGFVVIDVSTPREPVEVARLELGALNSMAVHDGLVYVTCEEGQFEGLNVIDVSNPELPAVVGQLNIGGFPQAVAVSGTVAFIGCASGELWAVDVSRVDSPEVIGGLSLDDRISRLEVSGACLFVAAEHDSQLHVVNISDPSNPRLVHKATTRDQPLDLFVHRGQVVLAEGNWGVSWRSVVECDCRLEHEPISEQ